MPKWLDLPPLWLIAMMALMYLDAIYVAPMPEWPMPWLGGAVMALGVALAGLAAISFRAQKTTIVPHQAPSALITSGAFAYSRNPIYLADVIILVGWGLIWGAILPFVLVPIFIWILTSRFIKPEEARLHAAFGEEFETYAMQVGRWF